jgi:hypothetical protein
MGWRILVNFICQPMLKLKTHSGFHDLFLTFIYRAMLSEDRWKESSEAVVCLTEDDCCIPVFSSFLK